MCDFKIRFHWILELRILFIKQYKLMMHMQNTFVLKFIHSTLLANGENVILNAINLKKKSKITSTPYT